MTNSFQITQSRVTVDNNEYKNFSNLYLFHTPKGPNKNQVAVTSSDAATGLGPIVVNNWPIYDGVGQGAAVVARAQGLHIQAGNWSNVFTIVFEDKSYKGSTLEVMGISVEDGEYAIVGGTGQFSMARGVIYKSLKEQRSDSNIIQLTIRGFFPVLKVVQPPAPPPPKPTGVLRIGPCGGNGGQAFDIAPDVPTRLVSITIYYAGVIDGIEFSYVNQHGQTRNSGRWCGRGGHAQPIPLGQSEVVKEIFGTIGAYSQYNNIIRTLGIRTNVRTYGPYGNDRGAPPFSIPVPNNSSIVGFFARGKLYLDAIGVYVQETQ